LTTATTEDQRCWGDRKRKIIRVHLCRHSEVHCVSEVTNHHPRCGASTLSRRRLNPLTYLS